MTDKQNPAAQESRSSYVSQDHEPENAPAAAGPEQNAAPQELPADALKQAISLSAAEDTPVGDAMPGTGVQQPAVAAPCPVCNGTGSVFDSLAGPAVAASDSGDIRLHELMLAHPEWFRNASSQSGMCPTCGRAPSSLGHSCSNSWHLGHDQSDAPTPRTDAFSKRCWNFNGTTDDLPRLFSDVMTSHQYLERALAAREEELKLRQAEASSAAEAVNVLFVALGWKSGGLGAAAIEIVKQYDELRAKFASFTFIKALPELEQKGLLAIGEELIRLNAKLAEREEKVDGYIPANKWWTTRENAVLNANGAIVRPFRFVDEY